MAVEDRSGIDLHPRTRYSKQEGIHVEVQGINLYVTPAMLQLAERQGRVETTGRVPANAVEAVFGEPLGEDMAVTVTIAPSTEADRD